MVQIKNNYQIKWVKKNPYGDVYEEGTGVFNGDTGIIRNILDIEETVIVEFEEGKDAKQVMKEVLKACRKVEPDCEIEIQLEAVFYGAPDAESGRGADLKYIIQQISKY